MPAHAHTHLYLPAQARSSSSAPSAQKDKRARLFSVHPPKRAGGMCLSLRARSCRAAQKDVCPCPQQRACGPRQTHTPQPQGGARAATERNGGFQGRGGVARAAARGGHTHAERARAACAAQCGQRSAAGWEAGGARAQRCAAPCGRLRAPRQTAKPLRRRRRPCVCGGAHPRARRVTMPAHAARTAAATRAWPGSHARRGARGGREGGDCTAAVSRPAAALQLRR
jgi:hypothetical protein